MRREIGLSLCVILGLCGCQNQSGGFQLGSRPEAEPAADANEQKPMGPEFTASPASASATPVQVVGGVSLWGELPGSDRSAPTDSADNLRQVSFTQEGADFDLDIDPAGKFMVFASTQHRHTSDLYVKRIDGTTVTQLTTDAANDVMPTFSPDGSAVAFCSDRSGNWDLYLQKLEGGQPIQLTSDASQELHPSFSPDGKHLVFCSLGAQSGQWEIIVIDVEMPSKRHVLGYGLFPSFSPRGDKIAFQRARYRGTRTFGVWTVDYVNGEAARPTEIAAAVNAACINPCWSPDGKRLAFSTVVNPPEDPNSRPQMADLWSVNLDGSGRVKLTNDSHANLQPAWGKDGVIYFVSNRNGRENIWALKPPGQPAIAAQPQPMTVPAAPTPPAAKPVGKPTAEVKTEP